MTLVRTPAPPPAPPATFQQRVTYLRYLAAWEAIARLPDGLARRLPDRIGTAWFAAAPTHQRQQVRRNLARLVPGTAPDALTELVRAAYVSYARYWIDAFRLHRMDAAEVVGAATADGLHHIDRVRDERTGGIFATGHLGSWDVGAFFTAQRDWRMVVVAEVLQPRALFDRFVQLREQAGIAVVPLVRGGDVLGALDAMIREEAALVTLLADRDLGRRGPIVSFFGEPCRLPAGPAVLAQRTGLPVHVGGFFTAGDGFHGVVRAPRPVDPEDTWGATQSVAHELERLIRRAPEQWHVFVANWLADREPDHPVVAAWRAGDDWRALARRSAIGDRVAS